MRPAPASGPRLGFVGGAGSLALHAGMLAALLWSGSRAAPPTAPDAPIIEVALVAQPVPEPVAPPHPAEAPPPPPRTREKPTRQPPVPARATATRPRPTAPVMTASDPAPVVPPAADPSPSEGSGPATDALALAGSGPGHATTGTTAGEPGGGGGRQAAEALETPPPPYPPSARRRGLEGRLVLRVTIDSSGRPASVTLLRSSGADSLDAAAREAVEGWRFRPARHEGQPIASDIVVPIRFQLNGPTEADVAPPE